MRAHTLTTSRTCDSEDRSQAQGEASEFKWTHAQKWQLLVSNFFANQKMEKDVPGYDASELGEYLVDQGVCTEVVLNFEKNHVTGQSFLKLSEDDLKELVRPVGVRPVIRDILKKVNHVSCLYS